jgi:hypothetical protein
MIAPHQHLAKVQNEMSDIRRHHGSDWRIRQRNLHERILHRHRRGAAQTRDDREYCVAVGPWTPRNANPEESNEKKQQQQQRRNANLFEATSEQARQK